MSIISELIKESDNNNRIRGYASRGGFGNSILNNIEIGTLEGRYYAFKEENKPRRIEVWLHLNRPISADECSEFKCILQENSIPEGDIKCNELYDYHLPFFSVAWLEDIFPKLLSTKMPQPQNTSEQKQSKQPVEEMLECALKCGCDVLDMSTMTIYSAR